MPLLNRNSLKNYFREGNSPSEVNFSDLIDSTINKVDDGFSKDEKNGLILSPQGENPNLISFYEDVRNPDAAWAIAIDKDKKNKGLSFLHEGENNSLFLGQNGNVGINTNAPNYNLEVNGIIGAKTRIGTFKSGEAAADGSWHPILEKLDDVQAFEVVARVRGRKGHGKYALTHAIAIATFGRSSWRIKHTRAYFGWFWNRISLRWKGDIHEYQLQLRTVSNYGFENESTKEPFKIQYHITQLWDEEKFGISEAK